MTSQARVMAANRSHAAFKPASGLGPGQLREPGAARGGLHEGPLYS